MQNKTVLITGCSSGIGKALSEEFYKCGFHVIATARRLDSIGNLRAKGMSTYSLDVTDDAEIDQVVSDIMKKKKQIDILVNNAGYGLMGPVIEIPENDLEQQFRTNVIAPLVLAQKVVPVMKEQGHGLIVNIGSISGIVTTPFSGAYCASKSALHSLSDALRMELEPFGINVVTVQPGAIKSQFGKTASKVSSHILNSRSWYKQLEKEIKMRAEISQTDATSAEEFAEKLVSAVMEEKPPAIVRIGKKSFMLPMLKKLVPVSILDNILENKFGLSRIHNE